jgi:hypothetical protein
LINDINYFWILDFSSSTFYFQRFSLDFFSTFFHPFLHTIELNIQHLWNIINNNILHHLKHLWKIIIIFKCHHQHHSISYYFRNVNHQSNGHICYQFWRLKTMIIFFFEKKNLRVCFDFNWKFLQISLVKSKSDFSIVRFRWKQVIIKISLSSVNTSARRIIGSAVTSTAAPIMMMTPPVA